jgi:hypothetical protein
VALGALLTAGLACEAFIPCEGNCLGWWGRVLFGSESASSFLTACGDADPNLAVGLRSSLVLLVLLVVDGAGDACLFPRWLPGPDDPLPEAGSHSNDISCSFASSLTTCKLFRYAFTLLTICDSSNIFFGLGAAVDFFRRFTVVWP